MLQDVQEPRLKLVGFIGAVQCLGIAWPSFLFQLTEHRQRCVVVIWPHLFVLKVNSYFRNEVIIIPSPNHNVSLRNRHGNGTRGCALLKISPSSQWRLKDRQPKYQLILFSPFVSPLIMCGERCCGELYVCFISIQMARFQHRLWCGFILSLFCWEAPVSVHWFAFTNCLSFSLCCLSVAEISVRVFGLRGLSTVFMCSGYRTSHRYGLLLSALQLVLISWHVALPSPPA